MSEWKEVRLSEVTSILGDGIHGTPVYSEQGYYYFINGNNLCEGRIVLKQDTKRVSEEEYHKHKKDLNSRTLLFSINGTVGNVAKYNGEPCILGKSACYFNVLDTVDKDFIYYVISSPSFVKSMSNLANGTTIKNVSLKQMRDKTFLLPSLETQHRIASILSSLDDKIAINRRICENLEAQAQALFKHWFIDFAPFKDGKFVESELGMIPEGWRVGRLEEVCIKVTDGSHFSPKDAPRENIPMLSVKDMKTYGFDYSSCKHISESDFEQLRNNDCVPLKNDILIAKDGSYLKELFICKEEKKQAILSSIAIFRPNVDIISPDYLLHFLKQPKILKDVRDNYVSGSAVPRIVLKDFKKLKLCIPPKKTQKESMSAIEAIGEQIYILEQENLRLSTLRDTLLPKLMSGQIKLNNNEEL